MGEGVEPLTDYAEAENVMDCKCLKHTVEEEVIGQAAETTARTKPSRTQRGCPGEVKSGGGDHCQQLGRG